MHTSNRANYSSSGQPLVADKTLRRCESFDASSSFGLDQLSSAAYSRRVSRQRTHVNLCIYLTASSRIDVTVRQAQLSESKDIQGRLATEAMARDSNVDDHTEKRKENQ